MARTKPESSALGTGNRGQDCEQCRYKLSWEEEKHFRDLVEYSKTGIFIVQDNVVVYLNPEQQRIIGPLEILNSSLPFDRVHPDDADRVLRFYMQAAQGEISNVDVDFRFFTMNEYEAEPRIKWLTCRGCLIEYKGRDALLVNMMDMTKAKELEHLLDIQDKMASLGRVAAGLAHEIRNPLSGINIFLSMLRKILDSGEGMHKAEDLLSKIQEASGRIEAVIRRVMDFSKPGEPKFVLADITKPVDDAILLASATLRKAGIELKKDFAEDMLPCRIDLHMFGQVILNLITNAAEAMKGQQEKKRIGITTGMGEGLVTVRVSDSGPGVPAALRDKIFDPFFTTKSDSTGIGLSICHRIITDHGGYLTITDSAWGGAEFVIEVPVQPKGVK